MNLNLNFINMIISIIGNMEGDNVNILIFDVIFKNLGVEDLDISDVDVFINIVDKVIRMVSKIRSMYGVM